MQICDNARIQVCKYAIVKVFKYEGMEAFRLWSKQKESLKENSSVALLSPTCFNICLFVEYIGNQETDFQNVLLKTEIHMKILNIEPFLCNFSGLRYLQNKMWFRDKQVHFLTDLKWFSQHQSGLARG